MSEPPTPSEVNRGLEDLRSEVRTGYASINARLDRMPTSELLMAHLSRTDAELRAVGEDITEIREFAKEEVAKLRIDLGASERRASAAWKIALTAVGLGLTVLFGVLGILVPMIGGGS